MNLGNELNDKQLEAVESYSNPMLILAGAGSGKTRVITYKIAYFIKNRIFHENEIIAMTFTNKAAKEMKERICKMLGHPIYQMWVGTFHSLCSRLLRLEADNFGFDRKFTIYDQSDQEKIVKTLIKKLDFDIERLTPKKVLNKISDLKNKLIDEKQYQKRKLNFEDVKISEIYTHYQKILKENNAFDFDDLLMRTYLYLKSNKSILEKYHDKFKYILVDEFQDTNHTQYELIKLLSYNMKNISVVGDDDQSIYSWRGANIANILNFEKDFINTEVVKLEQNYRSTKIILDTANHLIKRNKGRYSKDLWTTKTEGEKLSVISYETDREEAYGVLQRILEIKQQDNSDYSAFTILYRTNAQSRIFEEAFRNYGIPTVVVGAFKFFSRKEVKDVMSYAKLLNNPYDNLSFERVITTPKRGIGEKT